MGLRLRSNEARRPFPRKPSGRRLFWIGASLSRTSQPATGMFRPLRLAPIQNPQPQHLSEFSDRLLRSGVSVFVCLLQPFRGDVRVHLSRHQMRVAQQFLHTSQVRSRIQEVRGIAMSQLVRRH